MLLLLLRSSPEPIKVTSSLPASQPIAQNIAGASSSATFSADFVVGLGLVMISAHNRIITGVTVGGVSATLAISNAVTPSSSIYQIPITVAGTKSIVVTASTTFGPIAISVTTLLNAATTVVSTATLDYGYPDLAPYATTSSLTVPTNGIGIAVASGESPGAPHDWNVGTEEAEIFLNTNPGIRHSHARRTVSGAPSVTNGTSSGTGIAAASWGPADPPPAASNLVAGDGGAYIGYARVGSPVLSAMGTLSSEPIAGQVIDYLVTGPGTDDGMGLVGNQSPTLLTVLYVDGIAWTVNTGVYNSAINVTEYTLSNSNPNFVIAQSYSVSTSLATGNTGKVKVYLSGAWVEKPLKVWSGTAWVIKPVKFYNGTWNLA